MRTKLIILCLTLILAPPSLAVWNSSGHMQVALVAWNLLDAEERTKLVSMLKKHPQFESEFESQMPDDMSDGDRDKWIFLHAATWPDIARSYSQYHHGTWHYVNIPYFLRANDEDWQGYKLPNLSTHYQSNMSDGKLNAYQALKKSIRELSGDSTSDKNRAIALCWIEHLVGDLHQPLHSTALFTRRVFPRGDRGGNGIYVGSSKLHSRWDGFAGTSKKLPYLNGKVTSIGEDANLVAMAVAAASELDPVAWAEEGHDICLDTVYDNRILQKVRTAEDGDDDDVDKVRAAKLSKSYQRKAKKIARHRIAYAGHRLAEVLKESLSD